MGPMANAGPSANTSLLRTLGPTGRDRYNEDNSESLQYRPYLGPKVMKTLGIIQPIKGTQLSSIQGPSNKFTWYKNKALHTRIAAYSDLTRPDLNFVSTSWRHPWDQTLGITLKTISAMANTTPIVATVTKPATKEKTLKDADATPRVDIQDFCEEHYEDILPVIMDKIRHDKRKEVHARLDFGESPKKRRIREGSQNSSVIEGRAHSTDLVILTLQAQLNPDWTGQTPGTILIVEAALIGETLLTEIFLGAETALAVSKNHMITPTPLTGRGPNMDITLATETAPVMRKEGGKMNPCYPAYRRAAPAIEDTGSQSKKCTSLRMRMTWWCPGCVKRWIRSHPESKYVKDPVKIYNIKQRDEETVEEFMERFKVETGRMKGAPKCMRISGFMHGVNNPELTKHLNEHVLKTMEEVMIATTAFIRGEAAAASKKKGHASWRAQDQSKRHASKRRSDFRGQLREGRGSSRFTPLTRTPKEILTAEAGKFKPPPPMVTPMEKRSSNKFCDLHNDKGHSTDEYQPKVGKKEVPAKDKSMAIYMIQPWHRMTRQKVTQSFERVSKITFPSLTTSSGTEGPLVIEVEIGGHTIHRMYVDRGSLMEVLYEHCFNRLQPEIKNQMVPTTTSLTGFSRETIWPLGQLRLLVTIGDANHSTKAWMNFMIVRSLSPYNGIIGRPGIREIQAVPSTSHRMLKFPVDGGIVSIRSTILIPAECATVITSSKEIPKETEVHHENFKVALHPNFLDQEVSIGGTLSAKGRTELCSLLNKNSDIFAWQPSDMTGVPRLIAEHRLNIREGYSPV
ncbi:reverse transcriptase domain-containing protein [Tanacetum coccineum]